jgi:hypothetical protein
MDITTLYKSEFDRTRELVQRPDWYLEFGKLRQLRLLGLGALQATLKGKITRAAEEARNETLAVFEQLLETDQVRLGRPGEEELDDQDKDRQPIDTVVIHHSSRAEGISLPALNALHLLNLYVPVYQNKKQPVLNSHNEHQPIYSGHFDELGRQVFYGYHWKVERDGTTKRLLPDSALGWHAGNWEINKKSVGICIDDDLASKTPTPESLEAVAGIINEHYTGMTVIGHNEASQTVCPGAHFKHGWKLELLDLLSIK